MGDHLSPDISFESTSKRPSIGANIALSCWRNPLPLVARSPDRPYLDSASDVSLLLDAGAPCGFEPLVPP
jgi:hypothetical protein